MAAPRRTLASEIVATGIALHAGAPARLTLSPAPPGSGVVFRRSDLGGGDIPALWSNVSETRLGTMIANSEGASIRVVEHLLAALAGAEVDDCIAAIDGPELPILDGDAASYLVFIERAGLKTGGGARKTMRVLKPVIVGSANEGARLLPAERAEYFMEIDFASAAIGHQTFEFIFSPDRFRSDIAPARTFGFLADAEKLRAAGFARGADLNNALVIDGDRLVNAELQRFPDEFVRHKILDAIGDMTLAGAPLIARYEGRRASHRLNNALLRALFSDAANYQLV